MSLRTRFFLFDDTLAQRGVPPLTTWWRAGIGEWLDAYESGGALELVACVGRGAAKSTALYKLCTFFTLFGDVPVPPGERHYAVILSRRKEEASKGIAIISRWLDMLGARHDAASEVIDLDGLPRGIRVAAASVAATSGWRSFFIGKDERSKWPSDGVEELEAEEIDTSAAAMTATHPRAPMVSFGSAWGAAGSFFDTVTAKTTESTVVLGPAPTWVAAPHISKEELQRKERDPKKFLREYACVFQAGESSALDPDEVRQCFRKVRPGYALGQPVICMDASAGRGDAWCWAGARFWQSEATTEYVVEVDANGFERTVLDAQGRPKVVKYEKGEPELIIGNIRSVTGKFSSHTTSDDIIGRIAADAKNIGARHIISDTYNSFPNASAFTAYGLTLIPQVWSSETKAQGLARVRQWLRDNVLAIETSPFGEEMVKELIGLQETIRPSGSIGLGARRGSHDDLAALVLNAAMFDITGGFSGSPIKTSYGLYSADVVSNMSSFT